VSSSSIEGKFAILFSIWLFFPADTNGQITDKPQPPSRPKPPVFCVDIKYRKKLAICKGGKYQFR
jgi:hypothetical protein